MSAPRWAQGAAASSTERAIETSLMLCGVTSLVTTFGILWVLSSETVRFFCTVPMSRFFSDTEWTPMFADAQLGIWPLLAGTMLTSAVASAVALPLGLLAAIYLSEFAAPRARRVLKPTIELLAGVPTVVYGYFALTFLTPLLQPLVGGLSAFNALSPGLVLGILIMPVVISLSEEAISAVPRGLREAAYALGASKLSTLSRVVLPAARSGIAAAIFLAISRAIGETMIVTIAAGQQPRLTLDVRVPVQTMTSYIVQVSPGELQASSLERHAIFAVGATLFCFTFAMNQTGRWLARRARGAT